MGLGGISIWQLLIILAIVVMLFGTKRLRNLGSDLGSAVKGFRSSMQDDKDSKDADESEAAKAEMAEQSVQSDDSAENDARTSNGGNK